MFSMIFIVSSTDKYYPQFDCISISSSRVRSPFAKAKEIILSMSEYEISGCTKFDVY